MKNLNEVIDRWVRQADRDLENAEKMLKALYIKERNEEPPRTHSLRKLIELTNMPDEALRLESKRLKK